MSAAVGSCCQAGEKTVPKRLKKQARGDSRNFEDFLPFSAGVYSLLSSRYCKKLEYLLSKSVTSSIKAISISLFVFVTSLSSALRKQHDEEETGAEKGQFRFTRA